MKLTIHTNNFTSEMELHYETAEMISPESDTELTQKPSVYPYVESNSGIT